MTHEDYIERNFKRIVSIKVFGVTISGVEFNIALLKRNRSYRVIWKSRIKRRWYQFLTYTTSSIDRMNQLNKKIFSCEHAIWFETKQRFSYWTRFKLLWLVMWDITVKNCTLKTIKGKDILVYKDIKKLRL